MSADVGLRLKQLRTLRGLSQRDLAKRAGVTNGLISQVEQNKVSPSVGTLKKIVEQLSISLADFFNTDENPSVDWCYRAGSMPDIGSDGLAFFLVGHNIRGRALSLLRETYAVGADSGSDMLQHEGEEAGIVIRGRVEVTVGNEIRVLEKGDAYYFPSTMPHRFRNVGGEEAEVVSAATPATF